jgi:hypothetical protein
MVNHKTSTRWPYKERIRNDTRPDVLSIAEMTRRMCDRCNETVHNTDDAYWQRETEREVIIISLTVRVVNTEAHSNETMKPRSPGSTHHEPTAIPHQASINVLQNANALLSANNTLLLCPNVQLLNQQSNVQPKKELNIIISVHTNLTMNHELLKWIVERVADSRYVEENALNHQVQITITWSHIHKHVLDERAADITNVVNPRAPYW